MVPGQIYPQQQMPQQQMYMVADGTAAAGPIGVNSHPELYSKMMNMQQQQGFQAYANFLPQALPQAVQQPMLAPVPLSPERPTTMRIGPSSPATAVFNSPSNENFNQGGRRGTQEWNHKGVKWWGEMTYDHKQWVEGQYANARPTGYQGIKQDGKWLLCREESGAIHLLDHQVWSEQGAANFFASLMQGQQAFDVVPKTEGKPTTYDDVFGGQQGQGAQVGGPPQDQQADGVPDQGDDPHKKDKKKKKGKDKKGDAKGNEKGHGKGGQNDPDGGWPGPGQGKGGKKGKDGEDRKGWVKKESPPADGSRQKQGWRNGWDNRGWKEEEKKEEPAEGKKTPKILWHYLGIPVYDLPKETLEKHGAHKNWAYVLEKKPWLSAPLAKDVWPETDDPSDICPRKFDIMRIIHEGRLDACTPEQGLLDYGSGVAGYRDRAGNIHYKNGTGSYDCPRLYTVSYHRKDLAYLRPGACYFEHMQDENSKWYKQFYVGYRRGTDGTLIYTEVENWNGCFGRAGSDMGPYYVHAKKPSGGRRKKPSSDQEAEDQWGSEFGGDWTNIPDGTINTDVNWGPELANPLIGVEDGAFPLTSSNQTLQLAKGGQEVAGELEAAKIYGINFENGSQVYPRVVHTLGSVVAFGLNPKQNLESVLKPQRTDDWRDPAAWKLPRAVLIASVRGAANVSEDIKKVIGRIVRRELKVGAGEEDVNAMILLAEKIIRQVQKNMTANRDMLQAHVFGNDLPFADWERQIGYVKEEPRHGVFVSQLWSSEKECAVYVFADQLQRLAQTNKITMQEARAHFLIRCGERLKLEFNEEKCYKLAHNREEWNLHIALLKNEQAKGILWWDDPELPARLKAQNDEARKDKDGAPGSNNGGQGPNNSPGGAPSKPSVFGRFGLLNLPGGSGGAEGPTTASLRKYADLFPPAYEELIAQAEDLQHASRRRIAERCVETTLKMMRPEEIEKALSGDQEAAMKLRMQVSNTIMSKFLLYTQVETENIKPRAADLTAEFIDESLDELQPPSADEPAENRLRSIRSPVKLARAYWQIQKKDETYSPEAKRLTETAFIALWKTAEAVDKPLDEVLDAVTRGESKNRNLDDEDRYPFHWWDEYSLDWGKPEQKKNGWIIARIRMIRGVCYAIEVMQEAIQGDNAEAAIAGWLGIDFHLDCAQKELAEERSILTSRLNRGRGKLTAEPFD